jgi:hypothetical protein
MAGNKRRHYSGQIDPSDGSDDDCDVAASFSTRERRIEKTAIPQKPPAKKPKVIQSPLVLSSTPPENGDDDEVDEPSAKRKQVSLAL